MSFGTSTNTNAFLAASMAQLRGDDIITKILGAKLLSDNDDSNNLLGAAILTGSKPALDAAIIEGITNGTI